MAINDTELMICLNDFDENIDKIFDSISDYWFLPINFHVCSSVFAATFDAIYMYFYEFNSLQYQ